MNSASLAISRCNCNCGVVLWAFSTPVNTCRSSSINWYFNIITPACLSTYKCRCPFIMSERVIIIHLVTDPHLSPVVPLSCGLDSAAYCLGEVFFFFFSSLLSAATCSSTAAHPLSLCSCWLTRVQIGSSSQSPTQPPSLCFSPLSVTSLSLSLCFYTIHIFPFLLQRSLFFLTSPLILFIYIYILFFPLTSNLLSPHHCSQGWTSNADATCCNSRTHDKKKKTFYPQPKIVDNQRQHTLDTNSSFNCTHVPWCKCVFFLRDDDCRS